MITQRKSSEVLDWWHQCLPKWLPKADIGTPTGFQLDVLAGDGSQRTFFRVQVTPTQKNHNREGASFILLSDPGWYLSKDYAPHQVYLAGAGIPVPRFFFEDAKEGFLVMEDLGDELLQLRLQKEPQKKDDWLEQAVTLLAELHHRTFPVPNELPVASRSFDQTKYSEELNFTAEHLVHKWLGMPAIGDAEKADIAAFSGTIANLKPLVFSHRDYHCRNLLVHQDRLYMIDFQDARLGSPHYDLASLIYDAYVPITPAFRQKLIGIYKTTVTPTPLGAAIDWVNFDADLKRVAFQRVIKAAGSFASFVTRFGKTTHLPYLVPALEYARQLQTEVAALPQSSSPFFHVDKWLAAAKDKIRAGT